MNTISGSEILITGGAGFIGSNLARSLVKKGANVTLLDAMIAPYGGNDFNLHDIRKKIKFIHGDIRTKKHVEKSIDGKDFVFHLAGQTGRVISMDNPVLDTQINSIGTLNILDTIRRQIRKPKIIFSSSRGVIGSPVYLPVDEKHPTSPRDIYGINKLAAEQSCLLFGTHYGFGATALRLNNVYGPGCQIKSNHYGTINLFISYALQKKILPVYGDGKQTRDYVYIDDVVHAFILSMDKKADNEFYFVGTGKAASLLKVIKIIKTKIMDTQHEMVSFPKTLQSVDFNQFYSTSKKIENALLWKPKISLEKGINKTIEFYEKNLNHYL